MRTYKALIWLMAHLVGLHLVACVEVIPEPTDYSAFRQREILDRPITPRPSDGQTWLVTTAYRADEAGSTVVDPASEAGDAIDGEILLSNGLSSLVTAAITAAEVGPASTTWEFSVIDSDYLPDEGSVFYDVSLDEAGAPQALTLLEAVIYSERGTGWVAKELAPLFQLVLRRSDYRLLAIRVSCLIDGERTTELIDPAGFQQTALALELESSHVLLDFVLPEFPLEQAGQREMTVVRAEDGGVEVAFTSAVDGSLVVQRWDAGQPWFTYSRSDDRFSWLGLDPR